MEVPKMETMMTPNLPAFDHNKPFPTGVANPHNHLIVPWGGNGHWGDYSRIDDETWHPAYEMASGYILLARGVFDRICVEWWSDCDDEYSTNCIVAYDLVTGISILREPLSQRIVTSFFKGEIFELLASILRYLGKDFEWSYTGYRPDNFSIGIPHDAHNSLTNGESTS